MLAHLLSAHQNEDTLKKGTLFLQTIIMRLPYTASEHVHYHDVQSQFEDDEDNFSLASLVYSFAFAMILLKKRWSKRGV